MYRKARQKSEREEEEQALTLALCGGADDTREVLLAVLHDFFTYTLYRFVI